MPDTPPVPNYGVASQVQSGAVSNYNAITVSIRRNFSKWVSAHANYTWAHNMDEVSNGGIFTYDLSADSLALVPALPRQPAAVQLRQLGLRHSQQLQR